MAKMRTSSPYFVSSLSYAYSIPVDIQRLKCIISKQTSSKQNTCWRLACVADLVRASSLAAVNTSPKNACWCRERAGFKADIPCTTHTPVSFRSPAQHTTQGEHAKAKQK
jgi:hypothetical protein